MHFSCQSVLLASCVLLQLCQAVLNQTESSPWKRDSDDDDAEDTVPPFRERFTLHDESPANCKWVGDDFLNGMLEDSRLLAQKGRELMAAFRSGNVEAQRLVACYFFDVSKDPLEIAPMAKADEVYKGIEDWIMKGGPTRQGRAKRKPLYYCAGTYQVPKKTSDYLQDANGDVRKDDNGAPRKISSDEQIMYSIAHVQRELHQEHLDDPRHPEKNAVPYFIPDIGEYIVDEDFDGSPYLLCSIESANTDPGPEDIDIVLNCPHAFRASNENPNIENAVRVGTITPKPIKYSDIQSATQVLERITSYITPAVVLFHELIHLIFDKDSYPTTDRSEFYDLAQILKADLARSLRNPETYALAALAWLYTSRSEVKDGCRVEFFSGYTTQC